MSITLRADITKPIRSEWLAFTPINSSDAADVIEPIQQAYARSGSKCFHFPGPWATSETTYTASDDDGRIGFDEVASVSLARRPDADGDYQIDLQWWGNGDSYQVQLTAVRIDSDGTETQIAQVETSALADATLTARSLSTTLTAADTREGGLSGGAQAPIRYEVRSKSNAATLNNIEAMTLHEAELLAADLP